MGPGPRELSAEDVLESPGKSEYALVLDDKESAFILLGVITVFWLTE